MGKHKAPWCPNCNKSCMIAGGIVGRDINYWKCFDCGYRVDDEEYTEVMDDIADKLKDCGVRVPNTLFPIDRGIVNM